MITKDVRDFEVELERYKLKNSDKSETICKRKVDNYRESLDIIKPLLN